MDDQTRGRDQMGPLQRTRIPQSRPIVVLPFAQVPARKEEADVRGAGKRHEVVEPALGDRTLPTIIDGENSRRHQAAVGTSHDPGPVRVEPVEPVHGGVECSEQILQIQRAILPPDLHRGADEIGPPSGRSTRVGGDDSVPGADIDLELVEEAPAVLGGRATVNVEENRDRLIARRQEDPHVEIDIARSRNKVFRFDEIGFGPERCIHVGQRGLDTVLEPDQFSRIGNRCRHQRHCAPVRSAGHAGDKSVATHHLMPRPVGSHLDHGMGAAVLGDQPTRTIGQPLRSRRSGRRRR